MRDKSLLIGVAVLCIVLGVPLLTVAALTWMGMVHGWGLALLVLALTEANIVAATFMTLIFALRHLSVNSQRWPD